HALIYLDGGPRLRVDRAVDRADEEVAAGEFVLDLPHQQRRRLGAVAYRRRPQVARQLGARLARDGQAGVALIGADGGAGLVVDLAIDLADIVQPALQLALEARHRLIELGVAAIGRTVGAGIAGPTRIPVIRVLAGILDVREQADRGLAGRRQPGVGLVGADRRAHLRADYAVLRAGVIAALAERALQLRNLRAGQRCRGGGAG